MKSNHARNFGERLDRDENQQFSRDYITASNKKLSLANASVELELAVTRGELISKEAGTAAGIISVVAARQKLLAMSAKCASKLARENNQHQRREILHADILKVMEEIRGLPDSIEPGWLAKVKKEEKES